jgi:hypothetical protein
VPGSSRGRCWPCSSSISFPPGGDRRRRRTAQYRGGGAACGPVP